jgi:hypothetical protein
MIDDEDRSGQCLSSHGKMVQLNTMARALTPGALAVVMIPSHHKQWGRVSFEIRDENGRCYSDSLKIEMTG